MGAAGTKQHASGAPRWAHTAPRVPSPLPGKAPSCPSVLSSWLRQACPGPPAGPAAHPRGRWVKVGWDGGQGWPGSRPAPCVPHPVLNLTSRPAGDFPAASAPTPYPGRAGLLSKADRPWEVPRPPQGTPPGPGAHPRDPSVGGQCWGWYPGNQTLQLALQPWGGAGGGAEGPRPCPPETHWPQAPWG